MDLTTAQRDRACGVLLGAACGDALGVPYEFAQPPAPGEIAEMRGGGLGDFAPGEWSDDTVDGDGDRRGGRDRCGPDHARGAGRDRRRASCGGTTTDPPDIGIQTRAVLSATGRRLDPVSPGRPRS